VAIETVDQREDPDRRRAREGVVYPERRTGFDRRSADADGLRGRWHRMLHSYRDNPRTILLVLALFTLLNLADLVLTYRALILGAAEVNPVMAWLFDIHPVMAGIVKMAVGMLVAEMVWLFRRYRRALELSIGVTATMAMLLIWHVFIGQNLPL
jgi:hypothetical protein